MAGAPVGSCGYVSGTGVVDVASVSHAGGSAISVMCVVAGSLDAGVAEPSGSSLQSNGEWIGYVTGAAVKRDWDLGGRAKMGPS